MNTTYGFNGPNATRRYMTEWIPQLGGWASPHSNPFYLNLTKSSHANARAEALWSRREGESVHRRASACDDACSLV